MADREKKKKENSFLQNIVTLVRLFKYLANPIVLYVLLGLIILLFLAGVIGFFTALPGSVTGWISEQVAKIKNYNIMAYDVKDKEIKELANKLEQMGYDIENYGFVEKIERENAIEGNTYLNNKPQKGAIKSVTSKCLTAYIGEEKKMYRIAPVNYSPASITEDYYLMQAIKELGDRTFLFWGGNSAIRIYFDNIGDYDSLSEKDKLEYDNGKALVTYYFYYMKGTEVQELDSEEQELYSKGKGLAAEEATKELIDKLSKKYYESITNNEVRKIGVGMIVLKGQYEEKGWLNKLLASSITEAKEKKWGYFNVVQQFDEDYNAKEMTFEYRLDQEKIFGGSIWNGMEYEPGKYAPYKWFTEAWYKIMFTKMSYDHTVDLEEWAYKYGKPSELTLALHLATQAPDFVYKFATSTNTDAKVYLNQYLRKETYTVVTKNRGDERLSDHIKNLLKSPYVVQSYKEKFKDIVISKIESDAQAKVGDVIGWFPTEYYTQEDANLEIRTRTDEFMNQWYNAIDSATVLDIIGEIASGWDGINVDKGTVINTWLLIPIQGINCSYFEADTVLLGKILGEGNDLEQTIDIATPYIEKVIQHWYRNQYFVYDTSENKLKNAKQIATNFLRAIGEEISQNNSEIDILNQIESAISEINNIAVDGSLVQFNMETEQDTDENENQVYDVTIRLDVYRVITKLKECYKNVIVEHLSEKNKNHFDSMFYIARNNIIHNFGETYELVEYPTMWESLKDAGRPHDSSDNTNDFDTAEYGEVYTDVFPEKTDNYNAIKVIQKSYWKIESTPELVQIHNPIFEDNSRSVRQWLKEKYVIYNGESKTKDERLQEGKSYIQAKTALDNLVAMLDKTSIADKYIHYLKRDVQEFAQDYAFDTYQQPNIEAKKNLENIMPEYVPYTVWPSVYETAEEPWTKMIFKKNGSTELVAPSDCIITIENSVYKIAIKMKSEKSSEENSGNNIENADSFEYIYLMADGNTKVNIGEGSYKQGEKIGTATSGKTNGVNLISIKMQMLSYTKQKIEVSTRMNVRNKKIEEITEEEKAIICDIMKNITMYKTWEDTGGGGNTSSSVLVNSTEQWNQEAVAILNTAINRILSPYCKDTSLLDINQIEMGLKDKNGKYVYLNERGKRVYADVTWDKVRRLVSLALLGSDKTKEGTILGATRYYKLWKKVDDYIEMDTDNKEVDFELEQQVTGGIFYLPNKEYEYYQEYYINNKIRSIIMQLNEQKDELNEQKGYTAGYGKYEFESSGESIPIFDIYAGKIGELLTKKLKETIIGLGAISSGSAQGNSGQESIITSIIVTNVNEEISAFSDNEDNLEEDEVENSENGTLEPSKEDSIENQMFTDTFKIKVNANNSAYITITYQCEPEGKIDYNTLKYEMEEIPRL